MKRGFSFILLTLILSQHGAHAGELMIGFSAGPAVIRNNDFNGVRTLTGVHVNLGFDVLYRIGCRDGRFCQGLYGEGYFDAMLPTSYNFGPTRVIGTGMTGNYAERMAGYSGGVGLRKQFFDRRKLQFTTALALGVNHSRITEYRFQDALGNTLNLPIPTRSWSAEILPGAGITYKLSHKLILDMVPRVHLPLVTGFKRMFVEVPLGLKYSL